MNSEQIVEDNNDASEEKPEYLPHLSDKNYAFRLMTINRDSLPEGSQEQKNLMVLYKLHVRT